MRRGMCRRSPCKIFPCAGVVLALAFAACCNALRAQSSGFPVHDPGLGLRGNSGVEKGWVQLASPAQIVVQARREQTVELKFLIQDGLHINAHHPRSPYLIPTSLKLTPPAGVQILGVEYPQAKDYRFDFSPQDALSVYTGTLLVQVRLRAQPGAFAIPASLRYQACDNHMCNPPKTLHFTLQGVAQ